MVGRSRQKLGQKFLWVACAAGGLHAAFSLYWAFGGSWLLDTVGEEAARLQAEERGTAFVILFGAAVVEGIAAIIPALAERTRGRRRKIIRSVSWAGGAVLVAYGTIIAAVSGAVLAGAISPDGPVDRRGHFGHALLWNPLFALWGVTLLIGLWLTRSPGRDAEPTTTAEPPAHLPATRSAVRSGSMSQSWRTRSSR